MKLKKDDGSVIFIHGQNPQNILQCEQQLKSLTDANIISMFKEEGYDIEKELTR